MDVFRYVRVVLWSFFGIRREANASEEMSKVSPIALVVTAVVLAIAFAIFLILLATVAVGALSP